MWPASLQMTRDECRGILRRLELESYSHVISVFRAQGGLNENKSRLLEELRSIFHISQERHRAEARRVSNDEELSTIADIISGPNTWQEWAREGRRSFPMLPRVAPQTALALIANKVAEQTAKENAKLAYPADTAKLQLEHELELQQQAAAINKQTSRLLTPVVEEDPFKMPDIPAASKKNLKRHITEHQVVSGSIQKRNKNESCLSNSHATQIQLQKQYTHNNNNNLELQQQLNINNNINARKLTQEQKQLERKRFFYAQQLKNKKQTNIANKKQMNASITKYNSRKTQKSQKMQQKQLKLQQKHMEKWDKQQQQQQQTMPVQNQQINNNDMTTHQQQQPLQVHMTEHVQQQNILAATLSPVRQQQQQQQHNITANKKDLCKNFSKLPISTPTQTPISVANNMHNNNSNNNNNNNSNNILSNSLIPTNVLRTSALMTSVAATTTTTTTTTLATITTNDLNVNSTSPTPKLITEQKQLLSTPVQKYIVEDRLPPTVAHTQLMNLPVVTATTNKMRTLNTTILPPGTKLQPATTKKIVPITAVGGVLAEQQQQQRQPQQQLFNIITNTESGANLTLPTHAPPAIINLHGVSSSNVSQMQEVLTVSNSSSSNSSANTATTFALPTQGKVLTTKLMPVVFNNANKTTANLSSNTATNTTTLINTATAGATSSTPNAIIKTLPQALLLAGNVAKNVATNAGSTYISTLTPGTQLFRKPNILTRKGTATTTATAIKSIALSTGNSATGGTILGSYKLATPTTGLVPLRQLGAGTSSGSTAVNIRQNYKFASTANGKVIINAVQKLNAPLATTLSNPRVPLQKVQIIPASSGTIPLQHAQTNQNKNTLVMNNKASNMVFMPNKIGNTVNLGQKTNLVVIGSSALPQTSYKLTTTNANFLDLHNSNSNNNNMKKNQNNKIVTITGNNQLIAEDAPLDILNMPIIVENSEPLLSESVPSSTALNFTTNIVTQQQRQQQEQQQSSGIILGATDWEMELDQAAAAGRFSRRAYSVCAPATQFNRNQPFVLPRQLGRPLNTQFDSGLSNLGITRQISNAATSAANLTHGSHIVIDDVIVLKQDKTNSNNNNNKNSNSQIVIVDDEDEQETKEITTSAGTINVSEGGCIPMDLETESITTTTIIPASSDANPTTINSNFIITDNKLLNATTTITANENNEHIHNYDSIATNSNNTENEHTIKEIECTQTTTESTIITLCNENENCEKSQ